MTQELENKKKDTSGKLEKIMTVSNVSYVLFVVALLYPAWTGFGVLQNGPEIVYGYTIFTIGWVGIIALYAPWYFMFPAIIIVKKIRAGVDRKMLLSRVLLFLFWLEGYIAVAFFKWGGADDSGDFRITSIGPSFWMWTVLVWYILICAYMYVNFAEDRSKRYTKIVSIIAITCVAILAVQYNIAGFSG